MQNGYQSTIDDKLKEAWSKEQSFINTRGIFRSLIWIISLIITSFIIDILIWKGIGDGNSHGLWLSIINLIVIGIILKKEWLDHRKKYDPVRTALQVESKNPGLSSILITYTELSLDSSKTNTSPEIIEAIKEKANEKTESIDFQEIVSWGQIKKILIVCGSIILLFAGMSIKWNQQVGILFQRLAGVDTNYPTETNIEKILIDDQIINIGESFKVKSGGSLNIKVITSGVTVSSAQLYIRDKGVAEEWNSNPYQMDAMSNDKLNYERKWEDITEDQEFYVKANDDKSKTFEIQVIKQPSYTYQVERVFPSYINQKPETLEELNMDAPQGTELKWTITSSSKVKAMEVRIGEEEKLNAEISDDGKTITFSKKADKAFNYSFLWTEGQSGKDFQYVDVQNSIKVIEDTLPEIQLISPSSDGLATTKKNLNLNFKGTDDYGLGKAHLIYSVKRDEAKSDGESEIVRKEIHNFEGNSSGSHTFSWKVADDIDELKAGDQISYQVEVQDLFPGEKKHIRQSATRKISIVTPERYLQWYRSELASQQDEIKRARDSEETASTEVKQLRQQESEEK
ncbi:MAG: hypothetical protein CMO59_13570 [Verrucomicrobiales bacterium]|jgi:hypothetical protein|nr:hypothetical protein [Verrucomicrobiales bacterium]MEE2724319.1 DUF4175 family protein [Verrucomicrobiota bacterium]|tara:strand:- start:1547 stop:3256 length:1710 start_codon:yes stop_codon:yes gene_type:complete